MEKYRIKMRRSASDKWIYNWITGNEEPTAAVKRWAEELGFERMEFVINGCRSFVSVNKWNSLRRNK